VRFARRAVEAEGDVCDGLAAVAQGGPDALEVPAVCDEAALEAFRGDRAQDFAEARMKRRLAARTSNC